MQKMIQNGSTVDEIIAFGKKTPQYADSIGTVLR
tara:strand:+ start:786 stop:887 length:102 start_codon:yes stop_codon:yes gene_type:complete